MLAKLGINDKIKNTRRDLVGISNHKLTVFGQVAVKINVSRDLDIEQNFVVVPDEYLSSDILMGADLIGRASFSWTARHNELYWGGQHYKVTRVSCQSVSQVRRSDQKFPFKRKDSPPEEC